MLYWLLFLTPQTSVKFVVMTLLFLRIVTIPRSILYLFIHSLHKYSLTIHHVTLIMLDVEYTKEKKHSSYPQNTPRESSQLTIQHSKATGTLAVCAKTTETRVEEPQIRGSGKTSDVKLERWMGKKEIGASNRPSRRRNSLCKKEQQRHEGTSPVERATNISEQV